MYMRAAEQVGQLVGEVIDPQLILHKLDGH
jgi:hypothetical protein